MGILRFEEVLYGRKGVRLCEEHRPFLEAVERAADELEASRVALSVAVRAAHDADVPFRAIAAAAGFSHEQVRRIVKASRNA
jgi:hypothetical protein